MKELPLLSSDFVCWRLNRTPPPFKRLNHWVVSWSDSGLGGGNTNLWEVKLEKQQKQKRNKNAGSWKERTQGWVSLRICSTSAATVFFSLRHWLNAHSLSCIVFWWGINWNCCTSSITHWPQKPKGDLAGVHNKSVWIIQQNTRNANNRLRQRHKNWLRLQS